MGAAFAGVHACGYKVATKRLQDIGSTEMHWKKKGGQIILINYLHDNILIHCALVYEGLIHITHVCCSALHVNEH